MVLPKPSTGALNIYADPPSDSATSPTTSPAASSKQEDSDPNYTLNYEEPHMIVEPFATKYRVSLAPTHLLLDPKEKIRKRFRALVGSEGLVEQGLELPAVDRVHLRVRMLVEFAQPLYGFVVDGG